MNLHGTVEEWAKFLVNRRPNAAAVLDKISELLPAHDAEIELETLVECCRLVCHMPQLDSIASRTFHAGLPCSPFHQKIAAWHERNDPKPKPCEHKRLVGAEVHYDIAELIRCADCGATRKRGWIGEWEPKKESVQ